MIKVNERKTLQEEGNQITKNILTLKVQKQILHQQYLQSFVIFIIDSKKFKLLKKQHKISQKLFITVSNKQGFLLIIILGC
ncbi:unnamed protein product [Paramecium primaurelia]|uniref:Uncharacterized protein n=1 Tax=Paramecium primaurelia TaxID=5886 RepID=A0A8S1NES9_PARPR|nr:unnamed protein product [Paramecium primaurelia]